MTPKLVRRFFLLLILHAGSLALAQAQTTPPPKPAVTLDDIAWLLGTWSYSDQSVTPGSTYRDTGTRRCSRALENAYIRCESHGSSTGRKRSYVFYFNYNSLDDRFEMLSMHSDYSRKMLFTVTVSEAGRRLDLLGPLLPLPGGLTSQSWGTITYDEAGKMRWETRIHRSDQLPDVWPLRMVEESHKQPDAQ